MIPSVCIPCPGNVWVYAYRHMDAQAYTLAHTCHHMQNSYSDMHRLTHTPTYTHMQRLTSAHTCTGSHSCTHIHKYAVSSVCSHRLSTSQCLFFVKPQFKLEEELSSLKVVAGDQSECEHRGVQTGAACHALSPTSLGGSCYLSARLLPRKKANSHRVCPNFPETPLIQVFP